MLHAAKTKTRREDATTLQKMRAHQSWPPASAQSSLDAPQSCCISSASEHTVSSSAARTDARQSGYRGTRAPAAACQPAVRVIELSSKVVVSRTNRPDSQRSSRSPRAPSQPGLAVLAARLQSWCISIPKPQPKQSMHSNTPGVLEFGQLDHDLELGLQPLDRRTTSACQPCATRNESLISS